jgi:hemerythrin-like domain-containing protein
MLIKRRHRGGLAIDADQGSDRGDSYLPYASTPELTAMSDTRNWVLQPANDTSQASCGSPDPLALIEEDHALQLELCNLLEYLADCLPEHVNSAVARSAAAILRQGLGPHLELEEEVLFPLLRHRAQTIKGSSLEAIMQQLEAEHAADEAFAQELAEELQLLGDTGEARNPEMLGYMLRGFFQQQRRHIEWENRVLLPLARSTLTPDDLARFQDWIMSSDRPACVKHSVATLRRMRNGPTTCRQCDSRLRPM